MGTADRDTDTSGHPCSDIGDISEESDNTGDTESDTQSDIQ